MSRLIDADALIKKFQSDKEYFDKVGDTTFAIATIGVIHDIEDTPTIEVPEWIPCSERLPEEETECLVTDSYGCIRHCVKDKCGNYEFATYEEYMHIDAIAWMPLPKPYEETDDE